MGIYAIKPAFRRRLNGLADALTRAGVSPDRITAAGVAASLLGGACIGWSGQAPLLLLGVPPLAFTRIAANALDGMVAEKQGSGRPFGEFLNEVSDRISDTAWYAGLAVLHDGVWAMAAAAAVLISSYAGIAAKAAGTDRIYDGVFGKADRMLLVSIAAIAEVFSPAPFLLWFCMASVPLAAITFVQRVLRARELMNDA